MTVVKSTKITLSDNTASGIANGELVRNGALLEYHDGTSSRVLVNRDIAETLTNKTLTSPTLTSPVLTAPELGTPVSGVATNITGLPIIAGTTGTLSVARGGTGVTTSTGTGNTVLSADPTFTGDVTTASAKFVNAGIAGLGALSIQNQADNAISQVIVRPTGTGTRAQITTANSSDPTTDAELLTIGSDIYGTNENAIRTYSTGTGTTRPLAFYYDTTKVMEISSSGVAVPTTLNLSGNNLDNIKNLHHNISTSAGTGMNFADDQLQTLSRSTTTTFNGSNYATGKSKTLRLINTSGSAITLGFDGSWKFVGTKPTDLAGSKTAILTLTCFGSSASDVVAGYAVEE